MPDKLPVFKATAMEAKVDLTHKVVSLSFWEDQGAGHGADVWLAGGAILLLKAEIDRMIRENPEMLQWESNRRPN